MREVVDYPPLFDEIAACFPQARREGVIFAWGDIIYNPSGGEITLPLFAHETVHGIQQGDDITGWWRRYIDDPKFRFDQELPAHQAEYRHAMQEARNRFERRHQAMQIAKRLAGPLYGHMVSLPKARSLIKQFDEIRPAMEAANG